MVLLLLPATTSDANICINVSTVFNDRLIAKGLTWSQQFCLLILYSLLTGLPPPMALLRNSYLCYRVIIQSHHHHHHNHHLFWKCSFHLPDTHSSCSYPYTSPMPPPNFYRLTPNHPPSYAPDAQTLNQPHLTTSATLGIPKRLYKSTLRFPSFIDTPDIHFTIIRSVLFRLCRFQPSSPRFQSHMSIDSGHKLCISFPLCGMIHLELSG